MICFRRGSSRIVVILGGLALKAPRFRRLRRGVLANREEGRIWREGWQEFYPELCPVLAGFAFGLLLVMPSARILSDEELLAARESGLLPEHHPTERPDPQLYEDKFGEWGKIDGRYVVVDYAMRVYMDPQDIDPRVRTIADVRRCMGSRGAHWGE